MRLISPDFEVAFSKALCCLLNLPATPPTTLTFPADELPPV